MAAGIALAACLVIGGAVTGCRNPTPGEDADDLRVGPWVSAKEVSKYTVESNATGPLRLAVTNLLGSVTLISTEGNVATIAVNPIDGWLPKVVHWTQTSDGGHALAVLDSPDAARDPRPECPRDRQDGRVERLGYRLPRVDVTISLPRFAEIDVNACSTLRVMADADLRARCGTAARLISGHGFARLETPVLVAGDCMYSVVAAVSKQSTFSNTMGDKWLRGTGDVAITGGGGVLDVSVSGTVFVDGAISGGYAPVAVVSGPTGDDIGLIGPSRPFANPGQSSRDLTMSASRISAPSVEVRMPVTCQLEVRMAVSHAEAEVYFPPNDRRVVPHTMTTASVHFSVGTPKGELVIEAVTKGEVIIKPSDATMR